MSEWFQRQFGDRAEVALSVSLGADPHPSGTAERDLSWGSLEIWARDRCLTASVSNGTVSQGVRWNLLPVLQWFLDVGIRLVNEDPYPRFSKGREVADGSEWYDATLLPPTLSPEAEQRWFLRRSEWRHYHALRRAAEDVALPNLVFKRLAEYVEVSWDNDAWLPPRDDMYFVERRGRELVPAPAFGAVVRETLVEVFAALARRTSNKSFFALERRASELKTTAEDWRWLVHRPTAEVIRDEMPTLRLRLDQATAQRANGIYVPHTRETLVLRQIRLEQADEIDAVLNAANQIPDTPMHPTIQALVRPAPARNERPWEEGNIHADFVREELGWGQDPLPDLATWLGGRGVFVPAHDLGLPSPIVVLAERTDEYCAMMHVNPRSRSRRKLETGLATALGHVLLDDNPVALDGEWEHWPTSARARAFGIALMLPEDGVRALVGHSDSIGADEVRAVMKHYRAGPLATTHRLNNLGLITRDEREALVSELA